MVNRTTTTRVTIAITSAMLIGGHRFSADVIAMLQEENERNRLKKWGARRRLQPAFSDLSSSPLKGFEPPPPRQDGETENSERVPESSNSYYEGLLTETEAEVLETVEKSRVPITPLEISKKTGISRDSVRKVVRKLDHLRFVHRPHYGYYQSIRNVGTLQGLGGIEFEGRVGRLKPNVHNLQFVVRGARIRALEHRVVLGGGRIKLTFDVAKNGTVVVYVEGEFDAKGFALLIEYLRLKLGVSEDAIVPRRAEFNNDIQGIQLEGATCLTVRGIQGDLIRLYNKDRQTVRREVKPIRVPSSVAEVDALVQGGGLTSYYILQSVGRLVSKVDALIEAQQFGNRTQTRVSLALIQAVQRLEKILEKMESRE